MEADKLKHFREILLTQLRQRTRNTVDDQSAALEYSADGIKDSVDLSLLDVSREIALRLGEHESQMVADIDQALLRIKEGSYGICARCDGPINERRLEAVPTARFDTACQTLVEAELGTDTSSTL